MHVHVAQWRVCAVYQTMAGNPSIEIIPPVSFASRDHWPVGLYINMYLSTVPQIIPFQSIYQKVSNNFKLNLNCMSLLFSIQHNERFRHRISR